MKAAHDARDDEALEWLGVIERQQQEIELLRQERGAAACCKAGDDRLTASHCSIATRGSNESIASSVISKAVSLASANGDGSDLPMGSQRYAKICDEMERMRALLDRKNAKLQKFRAQCSEAQQEAARLRETVTELHSQIEIQRAQMARDSFAAQETIDKAVEKAAQALVINDYLDTEVTSLKEAHARSQQDFNARDNAVKQTGRMNMELQEQLCRSYQRVSRLTNKVLVLQNERIESQREQQRIQTGLTIKQHCKYNCEQASIPKQVLEERVRELEANLNEQNTRLELQAKQIEEQQQRIEQLNGEKGLLEQAGAKERADHHVHAAHLLKNNIMLQYNFVCEQAHNRQLQEDLSELREATQLLGEELYRTRIVIKQRDHALKDQGRKHTALCGAYRALERHAQSLEVSERQLVSVLIPTKKRLALLQETLTRFCYELEGVSKHMVMNRNREVSLGRALREYGKRNQELHASVVAARQQLHSVMSAFRSSEKRKEQVVSANRDLKRSLVVERCQRTDLLRQCKELEGCLDSCQSSAIESQTRAKGLENDNVVLQHAVTQLVAYAQELMSSQQSLQCELTKLEVTGKRQPAVYG